MVALIMAVALAAEASGKIVLRAEQSTPSHFAQQAIVFDAARVVLSRNSNFLCEPESTVMLGVVEAPYDPRWKSLRDQAAQMALRLERGASRKIGPPKVEAPDAPAAPHDVRLYIGKREVTGSPPNESTALRLLESACGEPPAGWTPKKAARVEALREGGRLLLRITALAGARKGATHTRDFLIAGCKQVRETETWTCPVPRYGVASLVVPR